MLYQACGDSLKCTVTSKLVWRQRSDVYSQVWLFTQLVGLKSTRSATHVTSDSLAPWQFCAEGVDSGRSAVAASGHSVALQASPSSQTALKRRLGRSCRTLCMPYTTSGLYHAALRSCIGRAPWPECMGVLAKGQLTRHTVQSSSALLHVKQQRLGHRAALLQCACLLHCCG